MGTERGPQEVVIGAGSSPASGRDAPPSTQPLSIDPASTSRSIEQPQATPRMVGVSASDESAAGSPSSSTTASVASPPEHSDGDGPESPPGDTTADHQGIRARLAWLAVATVVGSALAFVAPGNWPEGVGTANVEFRGEIAISAPVAVGSSDPVTLRSDDRATPFELTFPDGVPTSGEIVATIRPENPEPLAAPALEDVTLIITLPDGRDELVPIVNWDGTLQQFEALRRPTRQAAIVLGLLGLVVVLWVTEAIPLFVTSLLIPVGLVFAGVAEAAPATEAFFNPIIVLFFAGFLMAEAMHRSGLDHYVAVAITARAGRNAVTLFGAMIGVTAFMSMWMSNTAATAVLIPIAVAITAPLDDARYRRVLILGIAYAATIGGVGSAIGTPANQLAIEFLDQHGGRSISFVEWFAYGLPMVVLFLPIMSVVLWRRRGLRFDSARFREAREVAEAERSRLGRPDRDQLTVLAVFALVAAGWLTQTFHGIHAGIVALAGAVALFVLGKLLPADLASISWSSLLTFGGGLTLGLFLVDTGTSDFVATRLTGMADWPSLLALLGVALVTLLLTTVASNTASAAILIPLAIPLSAVLGIAPATLVVVIAIASSVDFALVIGTPPTMMAYSTRLFSAGQIFRTGLVLDLVGIALLVGAVTRIWELLGLV